MALFGFNRRYVPQPDPLFTVEWVTWPASTTDIPPWSQTEDEIRQIVREELAEFVPIDVPDAPPEDLQ